MLRTPTVIKPCLDHIDPEHLAEIQQFVEDEFAAIHVHSTGVMLMPNWNMQHYIKESSDEHDYGFSRRFVAERRNWLSETKNQFKYTVQWGNWPSYGVADSPEQFIERYGKRLIRSRHQLFITMVPIFKADQPASGGWRWHKWGTYVGKGKPQCEYLADEVGFDTVWTFHINRFKENQS